ncbi:MAG TPA: nucleotide-binding protein [bacterium]|nr:nucleotide-binding protein [bacterium]
MPRVFIGSSTEAHNIGVVVQRHLKKLGADVVYWEKVCKSGDVTLDALLETEVDAAILIANPDDKVDVRGEIRLSPRDNVLLELGMFLDRFGKRRTGILRIKNDKGEASLPTDLHGITTINWDQTNPELIKSHLKDWLNRVKDELKQIYPKQENLFNHIKQCLTGLPVSWRKNIDDYIISNFYNSLIMASQGQIELTPGQYYNALFEEMENAKKPIKIYAVAALSSEFWKEDDEQQEYLDKNFKAVNRGVEIQRLYFVPDSDWDDHKQIIKAQLEHKIVIRRVKKPDTPLEDMVMFFDPSNNTSRAYIADHVLNNPHRIRRGRLLLDQHESRNLYKAFKMEWKRAIRVTNENLYDNKSSLPEPGIMLKAFFLDEPVVSCEEAAAAKNIPLENELKTLILKTQIGTIALHLPGNKEASLRSIKNVLEVKDVSLASLEDLKSLGLSPGTVCAVKDPVWSMRHMISKQLLRKKFVSTNNGTLQGYYRFDPKILLEANDFILGDFENESFEKEIPTIL